MRDVEDEPCCAAEACSASGGSVCDVTGVIGEEELMPFGELSRPLLPCETGMEVEE